MSNSLKAEDYLYAYSDVEYMLLKVSKALKQTAAVPHIIPSKWESFTVLRTLRRNKSLQK